MRLFANLLAGHILLVTFALLTRHCVRQDQPALPRADEHPAVHRWCPFTAFEVLVAFLQAYVFTLLAAVYISNSMAAHDEH